MNAMAVGALAMENPWKRWEGQVVNGALPLVRYVGGSDHSAVFLTERVGGSPQKAAIKLIMAGEGAEEQVARWKQTAKLTNPALIRLFECGRCELEGTALLYVVMEYAEEDLSQIIPERALTAEEVNAMLPTILKALSHVHGKGLVHSRVKPSNIMAAGDQVKLASDTLREADEKARVPKNLNIYDAPEIAEGKVSPAADMWSVGVTLTEVLTQRTPAWDRPKGGAPQTSAGIPQPLQDIVRQCLVVDPKSRWSIAQIAERMYPEIAASKAPAEPPAPTPKRAIWPYAAVVLVVAVVGWLMLSSSKGPKSEPDRSAEVAQQQSAERSPAGAASAAREPKPSPTENQAESGGASRGDVIKGAVLEKVMPDVSRSARQTIEGRIRVRVRVYVDAKGGVTNARLLTAGPSKYFARQAVEAARQWKFSPAQTHGQAVASEWILTFWFRRSDTTAESTEDVP